MTLVNRVSLFFLVALGLCLAGCSALTYLLIRGHLYDQFDHQLQRALSVLVAAVEVESDSVKWQPSEHTITLGSARDIDEVRWAIVDDGGNLIDHSHNLQSSLAEDQRLISLARSPATAANQAGTTTTWRFLRQRLTAPAPTSVDEYEPDEFQEVVVTAARNPADLRAELVRLAVLVSVLPAGLWLLAAVVGRSYCRRALRPVRSMASRARSATDADFRLRLPVESRHDELSELALAFNGLLDQLQAAFERQRRFTGDAAHQLRTPLTVLRGQIEVALRRPRDAAEYRETLATLGDQACELQQVLETLLFLARSSADATPPDTREIHMAQWWPEYASRWAGDPRETDLVSSIDPQARVMASPPLLGQALDNLIGNAFKYSPPGSPVRTTVEVVDGSVELCVGDRGIGIDPQEQSAIFQPFYRSHPARQSGVAGTGLGLAVVMQIATVLGGRVECDSLPNDGSRFTLRLPLSRVAASDDDRSP